MKLWILVVFWENHKFLSKYSIRIQKKTVFPFSDVKKVAAK